MIITRAGTATKFVRSDEMAARVMQDVVRDTRSSGAARPAAPPSAPSRNENREPRTRNGVDAFRRDVEAVRDMVSQLRGFAAHTDPQKPVLIRADVIEHGLFAAELLPKIDGPEFDFVTEAVEPEQAEEAPGASTTLQIGRASLDLVGIDEPIRITQSTGSHFNLVFATLTRHDLRFERSGEGHVDLEVLVKGEALVHFEKVDYTGSLAVVLRDQRIVLNTDAPDAKARVMDVAV